MNGLSPLTKVWVDYLPQPKNTFIFRVNDADVYNLVKEEFDFDPSKIETLNLDYLKVNEKQAIFGSVPWIINDVEEKI